MMGYPGATDLYRHSMFNHNPYATHGQLGAGFHLPLLRSSLFKLRPSIPCRALGSQMLLPHANPHAMMMAQQAAAAYASTPHSSAWPPHPDPLAAGLGGLGDAPALS